MHVIKSSKIWGNARRKLKDGVNCEERITKGTTFERTGVDHIQDWQLGGSDTIDNMHLLTVYENRGAGPAIQSQLDALKTGSIDGLMHGDKIVIRFLK